MGRPLSGARIEPGRAGELLARIHRVGHPADSIHPWFYEPVDAAELEDLTRRVGPPVLDRLDDLLATLTVARADGTPPPADRLIRCHLDFVPDNVLVDAAGDPWVIDWENSGGGDPSQELAQAVLAFGGTDVLAGYEAAGGPGRLRSIDDFRMTFAVQANFLALCLRRAEGAVTDAVAAILANLVTVGDAEQLLATLRSRMPDRRRGFDTIACSMRL